MALPDSTFDRERNGNCRCAGFAPAVRMEPLDGIFADHDFDSGGGRIVGGCGRETGKSARHCGRRGLGCGLYFKPAEYGCGLYFKPAEYECGFYFKPAEYECGIYLQPAY